MILQSNSGGFTYISVWLFSDFELSNDYDVQGKRVSPYVHHVIYMTLSL